jgi:ABC-type antimicrobial peptide transport system permease subunit
VRVNHGLAAEQISSIEEVFHTHNPGYELESDFVSNYQYAFLQNTDGISIIFKVFACVAIFIAVMGLIGLSLFNNNRRTKEVGIHKAMGAHTESILKLLLSEFMKLVIVSNLVALPLAYVVLWKLFQYFSYATELKFPVFVIVFASSVLLSLLTVGYHAWRTARINPVHSLRYE